MTDKNLKQSLALCPKVRDICAPLKELMGMTFFRYIRMERKGKRVVLCSSEYWLEKYFKEKFYIEEYAGFYMFPENFKGISIGNKMEYYKHKESPIGKFGLEILEKLDLSLVMSLYDSYENYIELANFGFSKSADNTYNIFLNNQNFFEKFLIYFKSQMKEHYPEPTAISTATASKENRFVSKFVQGLSNEERNNLSEKFTVDKLYLDGNLRNQYLTLQECQCLKYVIQGVKYEQISQKLHLSKRSIENIMSNVKQKLGVQSKPELFEIALKYELGHKLKMVVEG